MIRIVTDSSALVSKAEAKQYQITVIPVNVTIGNESYQDSVSINGRKLIDFMSQHAKPFPFTSQPSIGQFVETYRHLIQQGDQVISIHMTHLLSGTVNAAREAARLVNGNVTVVDSQYIDQSLRHIVMVAAKMAKNQRYSVPQILKKLREVEAESSLYIGVSSLDNLAKGGRISRVTGFLTHLMNLHVVFSLGQQGLNIQIKGRGKKTFYRWLSRYLNKIKGQSLSYLGISYTGDYDFPRDAKTKLQRLFPHLPIIYRYTSATVANHTGNHAFAIMACRK